MPYAQNTSTDLRTQLAAALGDPDLRFWGTIELDRLIREALSTWAVTSAYWRNTRIFQTNATDYVYDLISTSVVSAALDLGGLINDLQFALMEPYSAVIAPPFTTTEMFTATEIYSALQRA